MEDQINWVEIYSCDMEIKAHMIQAILNEENIDCQLINKKDSNYLFGSVEIYVPAEYAVKAKYLIEKSEL